MSRWLELVTLGSQTPSRVPGWLPVSTARPSSMPTSRIRLDVTSTTAERCSSGGGYGSAARQPCDTPYVFTATARA